MAERVVHEMACSVREAKRSTGVMVIRQGNALHPPREILVASLLLPPPRQLVMIGPRHAVCSEPVLADLGDVHVQEAVILHGLVVEPWAIAAFPLDAADHAEFRAAAAGHVVAAFLELDHGRAVIAALPAGLFGDLGEAGRGFVFRALPTGVPFPIAGHADLRSTPLALSVFPSTVDAAGGLDVDIGGFDPFAAPPGRAVDAVLGCVFLVLLVPFHFELYVEELVDVLEGDVVAGAAGGRHVRRVGDGHCEDSAKTGVAHAVAAG